MSGGMKNHVFVVDGDTYDIPDDKVDAFVSSMARNGKQVREEQESSAHPVPTAQPQERDQPDPPTQTSDHGDWMSTLADLAVKFGLARRAAPGEDANAPARAAAPAYNARMQDAVDNPGSTALRKTAELAAPVVGGTATRGLAGNAAQAAAGLMQSYADDVDPIDALKGMAASMGLHGAGEAAFAAQKGLGNAGLRARLSAAGMDFDDVAKEKGAPAAYQLARDIEAKGLHKGSGPLGFLPQPAGTYAENAGALTKQGLAGMQSAEKELAALSAPEGADYRYHTTFADNLPSIQKQGLRPGGSAANWEQSDAGKLYLADKGSADGWAGSVAGQGYGPSGERPVVTLRTRVQGEPTDLRGEYAAGPIPAHQIEASAPYKYFDRSRPELDLEGSAGWSPLREPPLQVNWGPIEQQLRASAGKNASMIDPAGAQEAAFRTQMADRIGQYASGDWNQALANRRYLDDNINWGSRGGYEGAPMQEQVRRDVANPLRQEISNALDRGMASGDIPESLGRGWQNARDDFALGSTVQPEAQALQAQQASQGFFTPASLGSLGAAAGGFYTGHPVAGLAAGVGAQLARTRGSSAAAGALGAMSGEAGNVADWLTKTAGVAGGGDVAQQLMGSRPQPQRSPEIDGARPFDAVRDPKRIDAMLQNPQTLMLLSPWKDQLTAAGDDDGKWEATIEKLYRTDDSFRALFDGGR